ncbi:MAG: DEAD/DEAH box helicase [Firmicutes bacterium]|nr:DEAD/DEAH box helicase [Bacillota bacterium]
MSDTNEYTANEVFELFSPFMQDFIYSHGWSELREMQISAAKTIFRTDNDMLLTSGTASGKTEAALFPILSQFYEDPPASVGALYIAPLKSLINDQYQRVGELLSMTGINVTYWHGDVAQSHKAKLLKKPSGILQITPESLEAMLMRRSADLVRLFCDLRYIIIDEIHTLTGTDRGNQVICQITRLSRMIGHSPRRIGLSATVGDAVLAADWLTGGDDRECDIPTEAKRPVKWRLGVEHFYIASEKTLPSGVHEVRKSPSLGDMEPDSSQLPASIDPGYEYIYDCTKDMRALVFSNSREETEYVCATLRQIAKNRREDDVFYIHHGNLSASIREEAEAVLKDEERRAVLCATTTMELGIDIGRLERIVQNGSPISVSSFLQRLGRSGRRGEPPEMMVVLREDNPPPNTPLPQLIPWELLRAIAIIQLYIEERFIEPPLVRKMPFSLLFQQTLSMLYSSGELTSKELADRILSLPPFEFIGREDYRTLLISMIKNDFIEMTDEGGLIVGIKGERLTAGFRFYAVFKDAEDFTVRCESGEVGTITKAPPIGERFALAGRVWEVEELDIPHKLIYVKPVGGKMEIAWPGELGEIHTKILARMYRVLAEDTVYPYLKDGAAARLDAARSTARATGMLDFPLISLGGMSYCFFPWLGTRSFRTLRRYISKKSGEYKISGIEYEGSCYITFRMERGSAEALYRGIKTDFIRGVDPADLVGPNETPAFDKYDDYVPSELLRKAYIAEKLRTDEIKERAENDFKII